MSILLFQSSLISERRPILFAIIRMKKTLFVLTGATLCLLILEAIAIVVWGLMYLVYPMDFLPEMIVFSVCSLMSVHFLRVPVVNWVVDRMYGLLDKYKWE